MGERPIRHALLVLLLSSFFVTSPAWAGASEEAERQAGFAHDELAAGDYHRALKSAESALRLDPGRYDMFIAKARAYEGLGNLALAETLVLAYGELLGGLDGRVEALALLERLRAAREVVEAPPSKERRPRTRRVVAEAVPLAPPQKLDPAPYRERVLAALAEGQCNAAQSAAAELTMTAPEVAEGWRMAGDAARCSGDLRGGLLAYRRYVHQGGEEASTLAMISQVAAMFGTLLVRVDAPSAAAPVRARIPVGRDNVWSEPTPEGLLRLRDLPTDQSFSLTVSGRGLRPMGARVEPLGAGEVRELTLAPEWLGLATVTVPSAPDGVSAVSVAAAGAR